MLEKQPDHRFQNAKEVADLLGRHLAHEQAPSDARRPEPLPNLATKTPVEPPTRHSVKGRERLLMLVAAVVVAATAGLVVWQFVPRPPYPDAIQWSKSKGGNGHWYRVVVASSGIRWVEAEQRARALGGHLATITSHAEADHVIRLINDDLYWSGSSPNVKDGPWIDRNDATGRAQNVAETRHHKPRL